MLYTSLHAPACKIQFNKNGGLRDAGSWYGYVRQPLRYVEVVLSVHNNGYVV